MTGGSRVAPGRIPPAALLRRCALAVLAALLLLLPWMEGGSSPTGLAVSHTLIFLLAALAIAASRLEGRLILAAGWEAPAALAALSIGFVSMLAAGYLYGPFLSLWNAVMAALLGLALLALAGGSEASDAGARRDTAPGAAIVAAAVMTAGAAQALAVFVLPAPPNMTPSGTFANANQLAAFLNVSLFVAVGAAAAARRAGARGLLIASCAAAAIDAAALLRVGARGALIALVLVLAAAILMAVPRERRRLRTTLWAALAALALLSAAAVAWRFHTIGDPYRFDRLKIWGAAIDAARDRPLLGLGPGMFERRGYRYNFPLDREMFRYSKVPGSAHSTWLQSLAETGVAGLAAGALLLAAAGARLWRRRHAAPGAVMALAACALQSFVDTPFEVPAVTLGLIAVVVPALATRDPREAPLFLSLGWRRGRGAIPVWLSLAGALAAAWAGAVLLPWAAWEKAQHARWDAAIHLDAGNPLYHAERAEAVLRRGGSIEPPALASAAIDLGEASRLDPGDPDYLLRLARLHARACFDLGADPPAVARVEDLYRRALALGLKDPRPHADLALFLLAQGRRAEGIAELRDALALEPRYLGARLALVKALLDGGPASDRDAARAEQTALKAAIGDLTGYAPKNGYESDLMRMEPRLIEEVARRLP